MGKKVLKTMLDKIKKVIHDQKSEIIGSLLLLIIIIIPLMSFAARGEKIYVSAGASGGQDGSFDHPYKTINQAIKKAGKHDEIHVSRGTYKESIKIPKGVEIQGEDKDNVIIIADDQDEAAITMKNDTKIVGVTARRGKYGIKVEEGAKAKIIKCLVRDNQSDGIRVENGALDDDEKVVINDNVIMDNGRAGIFSEKRKIVIMDNAIQKNDSDGIELARGTDAWIQGNNLTKNGGSGMKFILDKSNIWTKRNKFYKNEREGIEINAYGLAGRVDIFKSKFDQNGRWAISRIQRGNVSISPWSGLTIQSNNTYWANQSGNITPIIREAK